jgi:hypothetical protein
MQTRTTLSSQFFLLFSWFILSVLGSAGSAEEPLLVTISKETTRITAPLKANGYPDYVAALNTQMSKGITAENNLAVAIWNTIGTTAMSPDFVNPYFKHLQTSPPEENATYYQTYYQWFQETLLAEEKTSELTPRGIDGLRQSLEKEHENCMKHPWTAKKFPRMAFSLDELIINHEGVIDAQLKLLGDNILALPPISKLADKIDNFERYTFLDATITIARDGTQALSSLTNGNSSSPSPALDNILKGVTTTLIDWDHVLRSGNYWYDEFKRVNSIKSPQQLKTASDALADRITANVRAVTEPTTIAKQILFSGKSLREIASVQVANVLAGLMLPALNAVIRVENRSIATHRITLTAIAVSRYKLQHNRYPDSLSAIKGVYLDRLPQDPFTGRTLKYQQGPKGLTIYSFGYNMRDDQGLSRTESDNTSSAGDDIIFRVGNETKQPPQSP